MASVIVLTKTPTEVEYSVVDGRVICFTLHGKVLYDEKLGITTRGWKDKLLKLIHDQGLHIDDGHGLHAFVYRALDEFSTTL